MLPDKIVYMANQIATFFESQPEKDRLEGVVTHLEDFWDPRMHRQLFEIIDAGGKDLSPLIIEAASHLKRPRETA